MTDEPLKCVEDGDFSVAMKFEVYPNRDSTVFMDRFGMNDCETFIRGTIRFKGFSGVISAFHDVGLTTDDPINSGVSTLRDLTFWRFTKIRETKFDEWTKGVVAKLTTGMNQNDKLLTEGFLMRVDSKYLNGNKKSIEDNFVQILKSMRFLGFFDDLNKLKTTDAQGKARSCLDAFGDLMAVRMKHTENDRDLVVMRHNFTIENEKKERWLHTSTWIESGACLSSGGYSLMSKSVGVTAAIGARLVLEGKIKAKGVVTPMTADIYNPIMQILDEKFNIRMTEESSRPDGLPTSHQAKL